MTEERKPSVDYQIAAAQAEQLRQRAERLPDAADIIERLKVVQEAAGRLRAAEEDPAKGKDFANEINALKGEIEARETRAREQQKQDRELIDAIGDLADDFTARL